MPKPFRILAVQLEVEAGNPATNLKRMLESIEKHRHSHDLFIFPEMAIPGYLIGDTWERPGFLRDCTAAHEQLLQASTDCTLIFGSVGQDARFLGEDGRTRLFNAAFVFQNRKILPAAHLDLPFWPKTLMANYREFEDSRHFFDLRKLAFEKGLSRSELFRPLLVPPLREDQTTLKIGLSICEDAWADDYSVNPIEELQRSVPLDVIVNLSASPYTARKESKRQKVFSAQCLRAGCPILYCNCCGVQNNGKNVFVFDGSTSLHCGDSTTSLQPFQSGALRVEITPCSVSGESKACASTAGKNQSLVNPGDAELMAFPRLARALLYGLQQTLQSWNISHVVVGVSGGIDSAVTASLYRHLLGKDALTLVNMPSRFNSKTTRGLAARLAKNLGAPYLVSPIQANVDQTMATLREHSVEAGLPFHLSGHVLENVQARDRGSRLLAALAAARGGVFSCNANKSELTIGYATLYGDAAGFLCPIGDLWKTEVYQLGRYLNENVYAQPAIPPEIFDLKPSAELSAEHDVDSGKGDPLFYAYHDHLFRKWVEGWQRWDLDDTLHAWHTGTLAHDLSIEENVLSQLFPHPRSFFEDTVRWWKLYTGLGAIKRVQAPPILSLSQRAFGSDHREPLQGFEWDRIIDKWQSKF